MKTHPVTRRSLNCYSETVPRPVSLTPSMFKYIVLALVLAIGSIVSWQLEEHVHSPRWAVKTLADGFSPDTAIVASSIPEQCKFYRVETEESMTRQPSERTLYAVDAYLIEMKKEVDNDYHLVLEDPVTHHRMIAEIPDGSNTPSAYAAKFRAARKQIDRALGEPSFFATHIDPPVRMTVTGLGFFDEEHLIPQSGMAQNCRELHPVVAIAIK